MRRVQQGEGIAEYHAEIVDEEDNAQRIELKPKTFSTGSDGFYGVGKVWIDGEEYNTNVQLVRRGSKPR